MRLRTLRTRNVSRKGEVSKVTYESIMLKNAIRIKKSANVLSLELQKAAMQSYDATRCKDGTMGQISELLDISRRIDRLEELYGYIRQALYAVPSGHRTLLTKVYLRKQTPKEVADKFGVSVSTVYRQLSVARNRFRRNLEHIGCDKQWFDSNCSDIDWTVRRCKSD